MLVCSHDESQILVVENIVNAQHVAIQRVVISGANYILKKIFPPLSRRVESKNLFNYKIRSYSSAQKPPKVYFNHGYFSDFEDEVMLAHIAGTLASLSFVFFELEFITMVQSTPSIIMPLYDTDMWKYIREISSSSPEECDFMIEFVVWCVLHGLCIMERIKLLHRDIKPPNIFLEKITDTTSFKNKKFKDASCITLKFENFQKSFPTKKIKYIPRLGDWGHAMCGHSEYNIRPDQTNTSYPYAPTTFNTFSDMLMMVVSLHWMHPTNLTSYIIRHLVPNTDDYPRDARVNLVFRHEHDNPHPKLMFLENMMYPIPFELCKHFYHVNYLNTYTQYISSTPSKILKGYLDLHTTTNNDGGDHHRLETESDIICSL